jgi:hypothetical protein
MDEMELQRHATRLQGCAAMGGFVVTMEQARQAVLAAEEDDRIGKSPTMAQAIAEMRARRAADRRG